MQQPTSVMAVDFDGKAWTRAKAAAWLRAHHMRPAPDPEPRAGGFVYRLRSGRSLELLQRQQAADVAGVDGLTFICRPGVA